MHFNKTLFRPNCGVIFGLTAALVFGSTADAQTTYHVDDDAPGGNGLSWANAFDDLQDALALAEDGDIVFVAQGIYKPTTGSNRDSSFIPANEVTLRGGYIGYDDADPNQRNVFEYDTILSGDIGTVDDKTDNSYHVIRGSTTGTEETIINGFIIEDGYASTAHPHNKGAGVWVRTPLVFLNCTFRRNEAASDGGAVFTKDGADVRFYNCIFDSNKAYSGRGGAINADGDLTAVFVRAFNCLFVDNHSNASGGALYFTDELTADIRNCTFTGNTAGGAGPVLWANCAITVALIRNCIVWDNDEENGQISGQGCGIGQDPPNIQIRYSDIEGTYNDDYDYGNNIESDPVFSDSANGNFRLLSSSPCIDVGNNGDAVADPYDVDDDTNTGEKAPDLDWRDRVIDGDENATATVDMGAYEFDVCPWDLNGDCVVGAGDVLLLLAAWGDCPDPPDPCPADFNGDDEVGAGDILLLLANWGPCPCDPTATVLSLEEELDDACLTEDDWDDFVDVMTDSGSTQAKKDNYYCWMEHYLFDCNQCFCVGDSGCPGADPFD